MRVARATTVVAAGLVATAAPAAAHRLAATPLTGPTATQLAAAVRTAERSPKLWATINICDSHRYPDTLGVRGQMPTIGFPSTLSMVIQAEYWSAAKKDYLPITSATARRRLSLGSASAGLQQAGAAFPFPAHTGLLSATVQFTWTRAGKVIGQVQRTVTAGHPDAAYGSPPHFSAATCRIP